MSAAHQFVHEGVLPVAEEDASHVAIVRLGWEPWRLRRLFPPAVARPQVLLKAVLEAEVLEASMAGVCCIVACAVVIADSKALLGGEALEIGDEAPVLVVQQQKDLLLDLQGARRHTS